MQENLIEKIEAEKKIPAPGKKTVHPDIPGAKTTATNYVMMIAYAIKSACADQIATNKNEGEKVTESTIVDALDYLRDLPLLEALIDNPTPSGHDHKHKHLAWRIAYKLAATSTGFDLLKKINNSEANSDYTKLTTDAKQKRKNIRRDENLRLFMKGADAMLTEEKSRELLNTDPQSLLDYCKAPNRTAEARDNYLLINALPALQTNFAINEAYGGDCTTLPPEEQEWQKKIGAAQNNANSKWAANALRNGFLSDAKGTPFDKANARLEKVSLQVSRGMKNQGQDVDNAVLTNAPGSKSIVPRRFKRNGGKTPFNGMMPISISTNGSLLQREKMTAILRLLEKAFYENITGQKHSKDYHFKDITFSNNEDKKEKLEGIAKLIYVRAWISTSQAECLDGRPLSNSKIEEVTSEKYLNSLMGYPEENPIFPAGIEKIRDEIKENLEKEQVINSLDPGKLNNFFSDIKFDRLKGNPELERVPPTGNFKDIPDTNDILAMNPSQYETAINDLKKHLEDGKDTKKVIPAPTLTHAGIGTYLSQQAQRMRLGSSIKFSDGDTIGIGMQGLTAVVARVFMGGVFGARANFSHRRTRLATAEFGVNAAGGFARFGTETNRSNRAGGGGSVGWSFAKFKNMFLGTGAYADGKGIYDPGKFSGVTLRLDRLGQDETGREGQIGGVAGDADMTVELGKAIKKVVNGKSAEQADGRPGGNLLMQLLEDIPQLSVSWLDDGDSTTRDLGHIGQAGAVLGAYAGGVGVGASASLSRTKKYQKQRYKEDTGALRSRVIGSAKRTSINAQVAAIGLVNLGAVSGQPILAKETAGIADVFSADAEIYRDGIREEIRTVEHNGQLKPRTYKLIVHANAESFANSVEQDIQEWGQRFAEIKEKDDYYHEIKPGDLNYEELLKKREEVSVQQAGIVRDLVLKVQEAAHPNTSYVEYLELAEATTIEINRYKHLAEMAELSGPTGEADRKIFDAAAEELLTNPKNYIRRFLFTTETKVADEGRSINFIGSYASTNQVLETVMLDGFIG